MPIAPSLMKLNCKTCGWKTFFRTPGDVVVPMPRQKWMRLPAACPDCGNSELVTEPPSLLEGLNPINSLKAYF